MPENKFSPQTFGEILNFKLKGLSPPFLIKLSLLLNHKFGILFCGFK